MPKISQSLVVLALVGLFSIGCGDARDVAAPEPQPTASLPPVSPPPAEPAASEAPVSDPAAEPNPAPAAQPTPAPAAERPAPTTTPAAEAAQPTPRINEPDSPAPARAAPKPLGITGPLNTDILVSEIGSEDKWMVFDLFAPLSAEEISGFEKQFHDGARRASDGTAGASEFMCAAGDTCVVLRYGQNQRALGIGTLRSDYEIAPFVKRFGK